MHPRDPFINLKNVTVIITGGLGLLGSALAESFRKAGAMIAIFDVVNNQKKVARYCKGKRTRFYPCDISDPASVRKAVQQAARDLRRIDVLVNCAYPRNAHYGRQFEKIDFVDWCENVNTHLGGYFQMTQQVAHHMKQRRSGSIINIASIYGMVAPDFSVYEGTKMTMPAEYAAIKGGLINLTRYLATYLASNNIRVNAVSPGGLFNGQDRRFVKNYCKKVPLGRMGTPQDVCGAVLFLASAAASYITGQNLTVDGGWTAW